jgi:hypothetical protein
MSPVTWLLNVMASQISSSLFRVFEFQKISKFSAVTNDFNSFRSPTCNINLSFVSGVEEKICSRSLSQVASNF